MSCPSPNGSAIAQGENDCSALAKARLARPAVRYQMPTDAIEHDRQQRAGNTRRNELFGRTMDHLVGKTSMNALRARHHLDRDQDHRDRRGRDPQGEIAEDGGGGLGNEDRLGAGPQQRQHAGRRHRDRPITLELGPARHLGTHRRNVGESLIEVVHAHPRRYFMIQSTCGRKLPSRGLIGFLSGRLTPP
jgi:hypothetical protein